MTPQKLQKILANNPDLTLQEWAATNDERVFDAALASITTCKVDSNELAAKFEALWQTWQGPELEREHRFDSVRRWRLDYYHAATMTGIELEGGVYSGGRHTRSAGFLGDLEKYNAAAMRGITVLRLGTGQVDHEHVAAIIEFINRKVRGE